MKDIPVFFRNVMEFFEGLRKDWKGTLGQYGNLIEKECTRAEQTTDSNDIEVNNETCLQFFERKLAEVIPEMKKRAEKYYMEPLIDVGFSPLGLLDPFLAPFCARAFLRICLDSETPPYSAIGQYGQEIQAQWKCNSRTHAFPTMPFQSYSNKIYYAFKSCPHRIDILRSLGFANSPKILEELTQLRAGRLEQILKNTGWTAGTLVSEYNQLFRNEFPAIYDSISFNYDFMSVTSVVCEQAFSCCNFLIDPHDSREYLQGKFLFYQNFTGDIVRKLNLLYATQLCNNKGILFQYHREINAKIDLILSRGYSIPSRSEIRGDGKKVEGHRDIFQFIEQEVEANQKANQSDCITVAKALRARQDFDYACVSNQTKKVPKKEENIIPDYVKNITKEDWQRYLIDLSIYTPATVPHRKTPAVVAALNQSLPNFPTTELQREEENPRKKLRLTENGVIS